MSKHTKRPDFVGEDYLPLTIERVILLYPDRKQGELARKRNGFRVLEPLGKIEIVFEIKGAFQTEPLDLFRQSLEPGFRVYIETLMRAATDKRPIQVCRRWTLDPDDYIPLLIGKSEPSIPAKIIELFPSKDDQQNDS